MAPAKGAAWRKSSRSGGTNGNCVEVTLTAVRDSKNPDQLLPVSLSALVAMVKMDKLSG
jgi:hypothetical protein